MQLSIESKYAIGESVERLQRITTNVSSLTGYDQLLSGSVSESMVRLRKIDRDSTNSIFRPELLGHFDRFPCGSRLTGRFGFSRQAVAFMRVWFGSVCVLILIAAVLEIWHQLSDWWKVPLAGVGVLAAGVLFLIIAKLTYRSDEVWITRQIMNAIDGTQTSP